MEVASSSSFWPGLKKKFAKGLSRKAEEPLKASKGHHPWIFGTHWITPTWCEVSAHAPPDVLAHPSPCKSIAEQCSSALTGAKRLQRPQPGRERERRRKRTEKFALAAVKGRGLSAQSCTTILEYI